MPVSHSQKLLCVSFRFQLGLETSTGFDGSATFQISWPAPPNERKRYTALRSPFGNALPSQTRVICAPPASKFPSWPGMWNRYFGFDGSVTSMIEVPLNSACPVSGLSGFGTSGVPP